MDESMQLSQHSIFENKNILKSIDFAYMEDEIKARDETQQCFKEIGIYPDILHNDNEAIEYAKNRSKDKLVVYILDINMGTGNSTLGIRTSNRLKRLHPESYVILLSSKLGQVSGEKLQWANADKVLKKTNISEDVEAIAHITETAYQDMVLHKNRHKFDYAMRLYQSDNTSLTQHKLTGSTSLDDSSDSLHNFETYYTGLNPNILKLIDIEAIITKPTPDNFIPKIKDDHISWQEISENLGTEILSISIKNKESNIIDFNALEEILFELSNGILKFKSFGNLSEHETTSISFMVLHKKTGKLYSFGREIHHAESCVFVNPGVLDFLDPYCETTILDDNQFFNVNIECAVFGVYF